jgi:hypothetical protein
MGYKNAEKQKQFQKDHYVKYKDKYIERLYRRRLENKEYINSLKANGCKLCGYVKCYASLEFHHLDKNEKDRTIAKAVDDFSLKRLIEEISKCILVCANCHREIHAGVAKLDETH